MKLDGLRLALFVSACALYVYFVAGPLIWWMTGGVGASSVHGPWVLVPVALVAVIMAPTAVLYRLLRGRW